MSVKRLNASINPTFFVPIFEFAQHLPCVSKHMTIVLLRQLHDNLHFVLRRTFVKCLEMLPNSQSLLCCACAKIIFLSRWLNPIDTSLGFGAVLYITGECPPVLCARGRPQLTDCCDDEAPQFWWSIAVRTNGLAYCSIPLTYAAKTSNILVVVTVLLLVKPKFLQM